jgi:hypothetical protein
MRNDPQKEYKRLASVFDALGDQAQIILFKITKLQKMLDDLKKAVNKKS